MEKPVHVTQFYPGSPEAVFDACLDPEKVKQWFMGERNGKVVSVEMNPVPGGTFSIVELTTDQKEIAHTGKYLYVKRPNWIIFRLRIPQLFEGISEVSINIRAENGGCRLIYHQTGIDQRLGDQWKQKMGQLAELL